MYMIWLIIHHAQLIRNKTLDSIKWKIATTTQKKERITTALEGKSCNWRSMFKFLYGYFMSRHLVLCRYRL